MGNWNITIQGTGCHHNKDNPTDADKMATEFTQALRRAGHTVTSATFTFGASQKLLQFTAQEAAEDVELKAGILYEDYCRNVGGRAFNGDPLPDWKTFCLDPKKQAQANAWRKLADCARNLQCSPA